MPKTSTSATSELARFRRAVLRWYPVNGRHALPLRLTRDPYAVLVSEVMLQQTQVERVIPYYAEWLQRWPAFPALAGATPAEVIRAWRGLGYNRRAVNLHRLAIAVQRAHGGLLPAEPAVLQALPGIGPYTAAAVRSFARDERVAVLDTNIARLLARVFAGVAIQREIRPRDLRDLAESLLPARDARDHNLALMDFGAMVCTARGPRCQGCPVSPSCAWRAAGYPPGAAAARPAVAFEDTPRFARGRIIDALRAGPATVDALASMLAPQHAARIDAYLAALEGDALAVRTAGRVWALPPGSA